MVDVRAQNIETVSHEGAQLRPAFGRNSGTVDKARVWLHVDVGASGQGDLGLARPEAGNLLAAHHAVYGRQWFTPWQMVENIAHFCERLRLPVSGFCSGRREHQAEGVQMGLLRRQRGA